MVTVLWAVCVVLVVAAIVVTTYAFIRLVRLLRQQQDPPSWDRFIDRFR